MQRWVLVILSSLLLLLAGCGPAQTDSVREVEAAPLPTAEAAPPLDNCPITRPPDPPFYAPAPYSAEAPWPGMVWYGSEALWTVIPTDGIWTGLPRNPTGYTQKIVWWREGYDWRAEPQPALTMRAERLDEPAPPVEVSDASNAFAEDMGSAIMTGIGFPTLGCWKITGHYRQASLSFVVWLAP